MAACLSFALDFKTIFAMSTITYYDSISPSTAMRDMVTTAISVNLSLITLQESEVTKRLAAYAALVAVPTMIVGVYGMNFDHMPELRWEYGYFAVLAVMAASRRLSLLSFSQGQVALG